MKKINCLGDKCPIPVIKTKEELQNMKPGESVMVVTDLSCAFEALVSSLEDYTVLIHSDEVIRGVWEITITKL